MSFRVTVLRILDVILRVPPLLVIDEIFKNNMGLPMYSSNGQIAADNRVSLAAEPESTTLKFIASLFGCFLALCIFMLWIRNLLTVYVYIISVALIFLSYRVNMAALALIEKGPYILENIVSLNISNLLNSEGVITSILLYLTAQWFMGILFSYIHLGPRYCIIQKVLPFCFVMPLLLAMLPLPTDMVKHIPAFAAVLPLALVTITLFSSTTCVGKPLFDGYRYAKFTVTRYGISALFELEWQRINVTVVLQAFWMIRQCVSMITTTEFPLNLVTIGQELLTSGCETLMAVLGMASIVSIICHYIEKLLEYFLLSKDEDENSIESASATLFYILALETGLTSFTPEERFILLCRNFCHLLTALFHHFHNIVNPILNSLSAGQNPSRKKHARALIVCTLLIITPAVHLTVLWSTHNLSTWLTAVIAFSAGAILKVLVSLSVYILYMVDARRQTFWEKLDDYVYYIRAFGNCMEFFISIFLSLNGAWILIYESGGIIRAFMMCVFTYFNVWCEARAGWKDFKKRRMVMKKMSTLPEATSMQLRLLNDVCAICHQEMATAKITTCQHYFHGICLRKWLDEKNLCPLCQTIMRFQ